MRIIHFLCAASLAVLTACTARPTADRADQSSTPSPTSTAFTGGETAATQDGARPLGLLTWGSLHSGAPLTDSDVRNSLNDGSSTDLARQTRRVLEVAQQHLGTPTVTVRAIEREGVLATDPKYRASDQALSGIDDPYLWAMCARIADQPIADRCSARAAAALDDWTATYVPAGNPINDNYLVPLLQAIDLECQIVTPSQCRPWRAWAVSLADQEDRFFASLRANDGRLANNWNSWHLLIRGMAATLADDSTLLRSTREMTSQHVTRNIRDDGSTIDFTERDALHYHVYDLEPLVTLALFAPGAVDPTTRQSIERGVLFLKPFVLGQSQHIEFMHTTVPFDIQRKQAGIEGFANTAWKPAEARPVLRLARTIFVGIQPWTGQVVDEQYSPRIKQIAALHGG